MKSIVCFGDSNTWGYIPGAGKRYPRDVRWTGVLRQELGDGYEVIEEGLNGRTTVWNDPIDTDNDATRNGKAYLAACIKTHFPLDLIIIMLGTNDLKVRFSVTAEDIAKGAGRLAKIVNASDCGIDGKPPKVLLVSPMIIPASIERSGFGTMFGNQTSIERSMQFAKYYERVAKENKVEFFDAASVATTSDIDAIHLEAPEHKKLGAALAGKVKEILG